MHLYFQQKSHVRTPTDPYEADLLMMAEIVANDGDKKEDSQNSGSDIDRDVCNGNFTENNSILR